MSAAALQLRGLVAGYERVPVVRGIDLDVGAGEVVALLGANGAGKTTTLLTVSGLLPRLGGEVTVLGEPVHVRRKGQVARPWKLARVGLAHVPEDRSLFFDLTAGENIRLGRRRGGGRPLDELLELFPALAPLLGRKAGLLSGGEQQMLALARALVGRPQVLLVDEMSLGLAPIVVEQLLPVVRRIADDTGTGVLLVEQHVPVALSVADRAYVMRRGRIALSGRAATLAADPQILAESYLSQGDVP